MTHKLSVKRSFVINAAELEVLFSRRESSYCFSKGLQLKPVLQLKVDQKLLTAGLNFS